MKSTFRKWASALVLASVAAFAGCSQIDTGNVGVSSTLGKVNLEELPPGVYQTFAQTIREVSVKEHTLPIENLNPKTKDNITMKDIDLDVRYMVNSGKVADLASRLAGDLTETSERGVFIVGHNYVTRHAREAVYDAISEFDAGTIHLKRDELGALIVKNLQTKLDKDSGAGTFTITGATIRSLVTDPQLEESIRAAAQVQFQVNKKQQEIELAKADAEVARTVARGQADANRIVSESLTPLLMRKLELETQGLFAGDGTHTVLLGGNATPLINVR